MSSPLTQTLFPPLAPPGNEPDTWPQVKWVDRNGAALHASPLGEEGEVLAVNLARGCLHRCAFCAARAYPNYPGDEVLLVYTETAGQVERELCCRQHRPRAVFISPSTDPFPAAPLVQAEAVRVVEVVAQQGIEAWLMTRGVIQSAALEVLTAHRSFVKVTVGLTTLDEQLQQTLEPLALTPSRRLQQLAELRRRGVAVQASIEPLLPGLTDTRANLVPLLKALASVGVLHVTTSYMFLRPRIQDHLTRRLTEQGYDRTILEAYAGGPFLDSGGLAAARYLPKVQRQRGYAAVMALAAGFAMTVTVCRVTNPDFPAARRPYNIRRAAGLVPAAQETSEHRGELLHDLVTTRTGSVGFPKLG